MEHTNSNFTSVIIEVDEKSNNATSYHRSVKSYATRVFQESTIGIISSVFTTQSNYRRFFKVFLSSLCIAGFIYHCDMFLNYVFGYPEVVGIFLEKPETYNMPAYTYCDNNPSRRSLFCSKYHKLCEMSTEEFCQKYSSYCGGANATLIPKRDYFYHLPYDFGYEMVLGLGIRHLSARIKSDIAGHSKERDETTGPELRYSGSHVTGKTCYTIHSRVESDRPPLQKKRKDEQNPWVDEWIKFYVKENEMMNPTSEPGVYFAFHSPFEVANPLHKGIFLKGGRTYRLYVEMQEEVLLEAPFESNCMDYDELWIKNNRTGARTKRMCREKCYLDYDIERYQCASPYNDYPHKWHICNTLRRYEYRNTSFSIDECLKNCRDECRQSTYTTEVSIQDYVDNVDVEEQHRHIEVLIYLSNEEVKVLRHSPKYESLLFVVFVYYSAIMKSFEYIPIDVENTVDLISSIGGFMGCWIGIGVMDILDVFGSMITVCRYVFRKKLNKENQKMPIEMPK